MKKIYLLIIILSSALVINGCGKKESAGTDGKKDDTKKEETKVTSKDVALDENSTYHIQYKMDKNGKGMTLELFRKGTNIKSEVKTAEGGISMNAEAFYIDKTMFMVMDMGGKKFGMKIEGKDLAKNNDKDYDKLIYDAKDRLKDFTKEGTGEVLGFKCDIYKDKDGNQYFFYKDQAMLKLITKSGTMEATKFDTDYKADDAFFTPPKDIDYMDAGKLDPTKMMKK